MSTRRTFLYVCDEPGCDAEALWQVTRHVGHAAPLDLCGPHAAQHGADSLPEGAQMRPLAADADHDS
jgi:hypothetical protein